MPGDQGASLAGTAHYVLAQYRAQLQEVFTHFCDGQSTLCRRGFLSFASAFDLAGVSNSAGKKAAGAPPRKRSAGTYGRRRGAPDYGAPARSSSFERGAGRVAHKHRG